jgi:hypothetical protein
MTTISIFSDLSQRHGAVGYAVVIVPEHGPPTWEDGGLPAIKLNIAGEIAALAIGVAKCPPCDRLIVYTDLSDLPGMMGGRKASYEDSIAGYMAALRDACRHFPRVEFRIVDRSNEFYRECHTRSRKMAVRCARRTGRLKT